MCVYLRIKTTEYTEEHGVFNTNFVFSSVKLRALRGEKLLGKRAWEQARNE